jgi:hypothetical protein
VVAHGLAHPIKYARLVRRRASSPRAQGGGSVRWSGNGEPLWQKRGPSRPRDAHRPSQTHRGRVRAAPCTKFPHARPNSPNIVMAATGSSPSRFHNGCTSARAASGRCSATCTPRFSPLISIQPIPSPRVPGMSFPGKVRRRACWQPSRELSNARKRGRSCADRMGVPRAGARLTDQSKRTDTRAR